MEEREVGVGFMCIVPGWWPSVQRTVDTYTQLTHLVLQPDHTAEGVRREMIINRDKSNHS